MTTFKIGDQVQLPRPYRGVVGTVIYYDRPTHRYLVRIGIEQQLYFTAEQLLAAAQAVIAVEADADADR